MNTLAYMFKLIPALMIIAGALLTLKCLFQFISIAI